MLTEHVCVCVSGMSRKGKEASLLLGLELPGEGEKTGSECAGEGGLPRESRKVTGEFLECSGKD